MLAVISGGSQGLGLALGEEYIERGFEVVLVARTESKLKAATERLGPSASYIAADVSDPDECERVFAEISNRSGKVPDLVMCCAGAAQPGLFVELSAADLGRNLQSVYLTALHFSHAALRALSGAPDRATNRRHLVFCSSTVAVFPFYGYSAYAPAKAAIRALSDIVRQECIPLNIRVSHILPGTMDTEGYAVEELTKPAITRKIEGPSKPLAPQVVARQVARDLAGGADTIYTDTVSWVLGSMMMGVSPRAGRGVLQTIVGVLLAVFGPVVRWFVDGDVRSGSSDAVQSGDATKPKRR